MVSESQTDAFVVNTVVRQTITLMSAVKAFILTNKNIFVRNHQCFAYADDVLIL